MNRLRAAARLAVALLMAPCTSAAQDEPLTLERALHRARERAPALLAARAKTAEARGRLTTASAFLRDNPEFEGEAGRRRSADGQEYDALRFGLSQTFETGGARAARVAGGEAGVALAEAEAAEEQRQLLLETARAFVRALHREEILELAHAAESVAADTARVAEGRHRSGDAARIEADLARVAEGRARAARRAAEAGRSATLGELRVLLGMEFDEPLSLRGDLRQRRDCDLNELLARAGERADLRALAAEVRAAEADVRLGRAQAWPEVGLGAAYERDEGADVVLATFRVGLPAFDRGPGLRAEAAARAARWRGELEARRRAAVVAVRAAFDVFSAQTVAVREMEERGLASLDETAAQLQRAYAAGRLGLAELLPLQRELIEAQREYADRLLEAATAAFELEASAGSIR